MATGKRGKGYHPDRRKPTARTHLFAGKMALKAGAISLFSRRINAGDLAGGPDSVSSCDSGPQMQP